MQPCLYFINFIEIVGKIKYSITNYIYNRKVMRKILLLLALSLSPLGILAETVEIYIQIKNHRFIPEIVEAPAGKRIRLIVHNLDNSAEEFESHELNREKIVPSKSKVRIILPPLKPGEYSFFGEFHEDTAQGKIIVKAKKIETEKE